MDLILCRFFCLRPENIFITNNKDLLNCVIEN